MLQLVYSREDSWPPLAWLACCHARGGPVEVFHGPRVETDTDWFHEAVWAGDAGEGGFDQTDIVFGSGGRRRGNSVVFVSAGSTLDRLHFLVTDTRTWVSNSLACLAAAIDAKVEPRYAGYTRDIQSVCRGLDGYKRELMTSAGAIRFTYYKNLRWDSRRLTETEKLFPRRDFGSYRLYRSFLDDSLCRIAENMHSNRRRYPYSLLGTLSTGYDSPAVTALARTAGLKEAVCFAERSEAGVDEGRVAEIGQTAIAECLGIRAIPIDRDDWRNVPLAEVPFLVGDAKGMDIWFRGAEQLLEGCVVLTGNHGDGAWSKAPRSLSDQFERISPASGLSLTEYRLWAGFIHCPVPYLGARQVAEINGISVSKEMEPWDVGGAYSRPIPRRLVEEAGVPRDAFGAEKRGTSVWLAERDTFRVSPSREDYLEWLRERNTAWLKAGRLPPHIVRRLASPFQTLIGSMVRQIRRSEIRLARSRRIDRLQRLASREPVYPFMFPWALERAKARYLPSNAKRVG